MDKLSKIFQAIKKIRKILRILHKVLTRSTLHISKNPYRRSGTGDSSTGESSFWNDPSGDRLREWLGFLMKNFTVHLSSPSYLWTFTLGKGKSGDLPPRKGFAEKWHPLLIKEMPQLELIVLIGSYAIPYYLNVPKKTRITDVVRDFENYLPEYFPLVHPSPRNNIWLRKNPWFEAQVLPELKIRVKISLLEARRFSFV